MPPGVPKDVDAKLRTPPSEDRYSPRIERDLLHACHLDTLLVFGSGPAAVRDCPQKHQAVSGSAL